MTWMPRTLYLIGCWLLLFAGVQLIPALYAVGLENKLIFESFALSIFINGFIGAVLYFGFQNAKRSKSLRVMILLPLFAYAATGLGSALPFIFYYPATPLITTFFEGVSMITTMGSSVLREGVTEPYALVLWRALASWCGGLGIMVMALTFLMRVNIGAMQLYPSEFSKGNKGAALGSIFSVSQSLIKPYSLLTLFAIFLFLLVGEGLDTALIRGLSIVASAGIVMAGDTSATIASVPLQGAYMLLMTLVLINIDILYAAGRQNRKTKVKSLEFRLLPTMLIWAISCLIVIQFLTGQSVNIFDLYFMMVSAMSTTGYVLADWVGIGSSGLASSVVFLVLALIGGGVLTTTGGIRQMRFLIMVAQGRAEVSRLAHPNGVHSLKFGRRTIASHDMNAVWLLVVGFLMAFVFGTVLLSIFSHPVEDSVAMTVAALTSSGPLAELISPNFPGFSMLGAVEYFILSMLMLFGRLETSLVIILTARFFWRK